MQKSLSVSVISLFSLAITIQIAFFSKIDLVNVAWAQTAPTEPQQRVTPGSNSSAATATSSATTIEANQNDSLPTRDNSTPLILTAIPTRLGDDQKLTADPGETISAIVKVRNDSDQTVAVSSSAVDFILGEDGETPLPVFEPTNSRWSFAQWITLQEDNHILSPNQTKDISVQIQVPGDALAGGRYAMITHQLADPNGDQQSASAIDQRVGTLLYLTINGDITEQAFIQNISIPRFSEYGPVPIDFTVDNQSDIHIRPVVSVEITSWFGQKVISIPLETKNIFPLTQRSFETEWNHYWGLGLYRADIIASYGSENKIAFASQWFWLFPVKIVLSVIIGILLVIIVGTIYYNAVTKKQRSQQHELEELRKKLQKVESDSR